MSRLDRNDAVGGVVTRQIRAWGKKQTTHGFTKGPMGKSHKSYGRGDELM